MRSTFVSFYMKYNDELVMSFTKMSPVKPADGFITKSKVYCPMRGSFAVSEMGLRWTLLTAPVNPLMDLNEIKSEPSLN